MPLVVQLIKTEEELLALELEWKCLFDAVGFELPFATFEWMSSWWKHMRHEGSKLSDMLHTQTFRTTHGKLVAIAPMILTTRLSFGPVKIRYLQFFGADNNITEARGILCLPDYEAEVYSLLLQNLQKSKYEWIRWSGLREGEGSLEVRQHLDRPLPNVTHHLLPLADTWEEFRAGLKRNIKESLRKCYNSLQRDNHTYSLRVVSEPAEIIQSLERFYILHSARAVQDAAQPHSDVFFMPHMRAFLTEVCLRLAVDDVTRIFELEVNGAVVASRIGFKFKNMLYLYYSGYDPEWAKYSVMTTNVAETLKFAIEQGIQVVHLSTGTDVSKTRWGTREIVEHEGIQLSKSPSSKLFYTLYEALFRAQHRTPTVGRILRHLSRQYRK